MAPRRIATLALVGVALLVPSAASGKPPAGPTDCGYVFIEGEVSGSRLGVLAYYTKCGRARGLVEQCGQNGRLPKGWTIGPLPGRDVPAYRIRKRGSLQQVRFGLFSGGGTEALVKCVKRN